MTEFIKNDPSEKYVEDVQIYNGNGEEQNKASGSIMNRTSTPCIVNGINLVPVKMRGLDEIVRVVWVDYKDSILSK